MKKIIHIASDEKFINSAYWQFSKAFPNQNIFYLLVDCPDKELKYVEINEDFILVKNKLKEIKDLAKSFSHDEIVCFHGLDYFRSIVLVNLPKSTTIIWFLWGMEIHNNANIVSKNNTLGSLTYATFYANSKKEIILTRFKDLFRQFFYKITLRGDSPQNAIYKAIRKANYCGILYQEEFQFIKQKIETDIKYFKFSYYPIELMVRDNNSMVTSDNILLGNSASESNNHLEAFEILQNLPLRKRKIITPLSYGKPIYQKVIVEKGEKLFPKNLQPLLDFMPLHEYNTYLKQCGIVIMNHYRQQAVGNVLTMLWMGAKVYLDERNSLYTYLIRIGIIVFSIQKDLNSNNPTVFLLLDHLEREKNRQILQFEIGQDKLLDELKKQMDVIMNES
ncbi:TDP-N-acetylfucosamine:lipid II N-acetylfucosaminyltransferase [Cyclobacterium sp.]|uniref:TDP-N-acetylfucosamine:lipid II N-acetylfucosaminyltransferase n=1 Tax=Cyclobacterium sp. TaxID=1966343 RepID=UPI00199F8CB7|nr:TDP-N-acetylfucosamine:lipid II N-acetylfucosaminyltransferase [Cyclobacterium sp.]MBD3629505.1 TDP-N-acetylfucosamine:lipid II N-acetylfucosaminyltransferase [Cyclobacterium sp.]